MGHYARGVLLTLPPWLRASNAATVEELQRRIRAMEVAEAPRRPAEVLTPYTAPSDIGRNWR